MAADGDRGPESQAAAEPVTARLERRYGEDLDPEISLDEGAGDSAALSGPSGEILKRLEAHGLKQTRYRIKGEVARGGMGAILKVWDEDLRRNLAMKVVLSGSETAAKTEEVDAKTLGRFLEEAQVTGQLDHPGIVPVHELGLDAAGHVYFTMRLVRGRDLKQIIDLVHAGEDGWNTTRALSVILRVCEATAFAHEKGVIHRDLKPANVMVGRFGEVYVMDWGLARVLGHEDRHDVRLREETSAISASVVESDRHDEVSGADSPLHTMDGDVVGTPAYMSPEQAMGKVAELDARTDVYSAGAMLYHLLSGQMPFVPPGARLSARMTLLRVLDGPPRPLHEVSRKVPAELVAICEKAMERDVTRRYASMRSLAEDLRAFLEHRVVHAYETGAIAEFRKWVVRNKGLAAVSAAAITLALGGLAGVGYVEAEGRREADRQREIAESNERRALASEESARRERANVALRLSAFQRLADLEVEAETLWPARPRNIGRYEGWLARAGALVAGALPSADGEDVGHYRQLEDLRERALPETPDERAASRRTHPRFDELRRLEARLDSETAALEVRRGAAPPAACALDPDSLPASALELNELAWPMVDPERSEYGREREGVALARLARERATEDEVFRVQDTLAWGLFALGLDEEALTASQTALAAAPLDRRADFEKYSRELEQRVQEVATGASATVLELEGRIAALEVEVSARRVWRFADDEDRWWHDQLSKLVAELQAFADEDTGLIRGISARYGPGIERRLAFARAVEERSMTGADARLLWREALASIREATHCPQYGGLEIAPQLGLVPIGRDPRSGLWEFAHLQTGSVPHRDEAGELVLEDGSALVLVLIPGGSFLLGAQGQDPAVPHFDPEANANESPVREVTLDPFFLSKFEMTQGQWERATGANPSSYAAGRSVGGREITGRNPVEQVSWFDCDRTLASLDLVLPTEAQWEYAVRAGTSTPYWSGAEVTSLAGAANLCDAYALSQGVPWRPIEEWLDDSHVVHAPAGTYRPNAFGLHEITGNLWEWCRDVFAEYYRPVADGDAARIADEVPRRPFRGGCYNYTANFARSASRKAGAPEMRINDLGVRPARRVD